jgi:predicted N-acyltransferase
MNDQFKIYHSISDLNEKTWNKFVSNENPFLKTQFLKYFEKLNSDEVSPFYITSENGVVYGHLITIDGKKVANYFDLGRKISAKRWLLKKLKIKFFCFGNTHLSNVSSNSYSFGKFNISDLEILVEKIHKSYGVNFFLLPDHFLNKLNATNNKIKTFEIDPDMVLEINHDWNSFDDYAFDVHSKYKKRIRKVYKESSDVVVKAISKESLAEELPEMTQLYQNVFLKSTFSGPPFNTDIYLDFINDDDVELNVFGYYLNNKLIAFSSEFFVNSVLYSYFIGLDYPLNEKYSIYNRILYDTIQNGISKRASKVIYGRTAAEFKSTIGAEPIPSTSAVYISNTFLRYLFTPILRRISPANWVQRRPFKKN